MGVEGNRSWVARKRLAVNKDRHSPLDGSDPRSAQRLDPNVEVVAERIAARGGPREVDEPPRRVGMKPVEALARDHERAGRGLDNLRRWNDADALGDGPRLA